MLSGELAYALFHPRARTDRVLLNQEVPNTGVGYLEALFYLGTSFLIVWTL